MVYSAKETMRASSCSCTEYTGGTGKELNRRSHKSPNVTYAATHSPTADPTVKITSSSPSASSSCRDTSVTSNSQTRVYRRPIERFVLVQVIESDLELHRTTIRGVKYLANRPVQQLSLCTCY